MAHPNRLQDARVLVFGGTSGIGFGIANLCLSQGSTVIISGSKQPKVDDKVALLRSYYPSIPAERISGLACDLVDTANLEANLKALLEKATNGGENKLDHITWTAGDIPKLPKIDQVNVEETLVGFHLRFQGSIGLAKVLLNNEFVKKSPSSSLTLTGGVNTRKPMPGWSVLAGYGGSMEGLMRGLAVDLKPIRVNLVAPGAIKTELWDGFSTRYPGGVESFEKMLQGTTLTDTVGEPSDTAEAYAWCMKDRFVTGSIASTNGGSLLKQ